eukprot:1176380-Prorocentrum_minimum.AAC.3
MVRDSDENAHIHPSKQGRICSPFADLNTFAPTKDSEDSLPLAFEERVACKREHRPPRAVALRGVQLPFAAVTLS